MFLEVDDAERRTGCGKLLGQGAPRSALLHIPDHPYPAGASEEIETVRDYLSRLPARHGELPDALVEVPKRRLRSGGEDDRGAVPRGQMGQAGESRRGEDGRQSLHLVEQDDALRQVVELAAGRTRA